MKNLVVLFAGEMSPHGTQSLCSGPSAFERSIAAAVYPGASRVLVLISDTRYNGFPSPVSPSDIPEQLNDSLKTEVIHKPAWTPAVLWERLSRESQGFDNVIFQFADTPSIDPVLTAELIARHERYAAEYTFAEGYPVGLSPEILASGITQTLARLSAGQQGPVRRDGIFELIKKDINSFDIETIMSDQDMRHLRITLACDTRQGFLTCEALEGINGANAFKLANSRASLLRTRPAFYSIQVAGPCPVSCIHCPYPAYCLSGTSSSPKIDVRSRTDFMDPNAFFTLIDRIASFSHNAVVSLSLWGECALHPDIPALIEKVLSYPSLSVLIETTGLGWSQSSIEKIARIASASGPREQPVSSINWIVSLDACSASRWESLHTGLPPLSSADSLFSQALHTMESLCSRFPDSVWPQMIRMKDNEEELELFYRSWKEKLSRVIIQKHDHFCSTIQDRRVADLSPLVRRPCWHLGRDMSILIDGTVPLCREDLYAARSLGNALTDELEHIWNNGAPVYEQHLCGNYEGMCGACDEFYTFNF